MNINPLRLNILAKLLHAIYYTTEEIGDLKENITITGDSINIKLAPHSWYVIPENKVEEVLNRKTNHSLRKIEITTTFYMINLEGKHYLIENKEPSNIYSVHEYEEGDRLDIHKNWCLQIDGQTLEILERKKRKDNPTIR